MRSLLLFIFFLPSIGFSKTVFDRVNINSGKILVEKEFVKVTQFNFSTDFDSLEAYLSLNEADTLMLAIFNNTGINQEIYFEHNNTTIEIEPGFGKSVKVWKNGSSRTVSFYSTNPTQKYLGLSSAVIFKSNNEKSFFWNLREYDNTKNKQYFEGATLNFTEYLPNVFLINSKVHLATKYNQMAKVTGSVGDTIYLDILNSGLMFHAVHFHGYHVNILESNRTNEMLGWEKDSFPLDPGELITVVLIPHQPGKYPVHDHNLKAVTVGGNYPGGMIGMLDIAP